MVKFLYKYEDKIIKDIKYLQEEYIPETFHYRDNQIKEIAKAISQFINHKTTTNLFLYGSPGTGKTSSVKFLFEKLKEETSKIKGIYINCWKTSKTHIILKDMAYQLNETLGKYLDLKKTHNEGFLLIEKYLEKTKTKIIVALDEVDKLEDENVLYWLSRKAIPLIMISNNEFALKDIDERIKSSLNYESIHYPKYKLEEIENILKERHKKAFYEDAFPKAFIKICAINSEGDARVGIGIMKYASLIAEKENKNRVEREDIIKALKEARKIKIHQILSTMKKEHNILYKIIENDREIKASDLYDKFIEKLKEENLKEVTDRSFRNYINDLIKKGLIESKGETRWRIYYLKEY